VSANLVIGLIAIVIGLSSLVVRFVLPPPKGWMADPYVRVMRSGWFAPLVFGLVPLLAGVTFLGAWVNARG
jgi:hypothetical protein